MIAGKPSRTKHQLTQNKQNEMSVKQNFHCNLLALGIVVFIAVAFINSMHLFAAVDYRRGLQNLTGRSYGSGGTYEKYHDKGCRTSQGGKGSNANEYDLYYNIPSQHACKEKCDQEGSSCYGYEYGSSDYGSSGRCEIWKVPINKVAYVYGLNCYINQSSAPPPPPLKVVVHRHIMQMDDIQHSDFSYTTNE